MMSGDLCRKLEKLGFEGSSLVLELMREREKIYKSDQFRSLTR